MIEIQQLTKRFEDDTVALDQINLTFSSGELTCVIGPSGCGKTTLLKHINRLITPTHGDIHISEKSIYEQDIVELRRSIGYVIQQVGLFPHLSVQENICVVPKLLGWTKQQQKERATEMLELVNLDPETYRNRYPLELSGGEQQRIGVARALAGEPDIILMDEPFSALDPISREQLQDYLKGLHEKLKKTIVFVTHDMDEALKIADRIVIMREGRIEQIGKPDEILRHPSSEFVYSFIGKDRIARYVPSNELTVSDLREWYLPDYPQDVPAIDRSLSVKQTVEEFASKNVSALKIIHETKTIGYLTKDQLLQALVSEKEVSS